MLSWEPSWLCSFVFTTNSPTHHHHDDNHNHQPSSCFPLIIHCLPISIMLFFALSIIIFQIPKIFFPQNHLLLSFSSLQSNPKPLLVFGMPRVALLASCAFKGERFLRLTPQGSVFLLFKSWVSFFDQDTSETIRVFIKNVKNLYNL